MVTFIFLSKALAAAKAAGHIFPEYAACEAALESAWGESDLARDCNNLFGQKHGSSTLTYPIKQYPTQEFINGKYVTVEASWPIFPDWETSFRERMTVLKLLPFYYTKALAATTGEEFIGRVSEHWATDPQRAAKVLEIVREHSATLFSQ